MASTPDGTLTVPSNNVTATAPSSRANGMTIVGIPTASGRETDAVRHAIEE